MNAEDMLESDSAFREQFDRESPNFHNGVTTLVPTGGQRVPDGMAAGEEASRGWQALPEVQSAAPDPRSFGEEYFHVHTYRALLDPLKKRVKELPKHQEVVTAALLELKEKEEQQQAQASGSGPSNDMEVARLRLQEKQRLRAEVLSGLRECLCAVEAHVEKSPTPDPACEADTSRITARNLTTTSLSRVAKITQEVLADGAKDMPSLNETRAYALTVGQQSQVIFREEKAMLQALKSMKKSRSDAT
eukprot:GHVU01049027.1.p1 GENE.GHVU01049027.1~~GHVU01049027.1.p1  ORF type:complete len:272 (+),score=53.73 GHVU01049027.1:78-818(+)